MDANTIAAWWGAVIATALLLWDIFKWKKSGERITITVTPDMSTYGAMPVSMEGNEYVVVNVTNSGDKKTTLTHLIGVHYKSRFKKLMGKSASSFLVRNQGSPDPLPHILPPGEFWAGAIEQNDELIEMSSSGRLYCGVVHSNNKKPMLKRVVIKPTQSPHN